MKQSRLTALYLALATVAVSSLFGCGSPLVGLECKAGYDRCGEGCFDPENDRNHCGGCDIQCAADEMCISGGCTDDFDSGDGDSGDGDSGDGDGGAGDGGAGDGGAGDGGDGGFPPGGDGGMDAEIDGGADDGGWADVDLPPLCTGPGSPADCVCELGELVCMESCVNPQIDTFNCGTCGNNCNEVPPPDGEYFCVGGVCQLTCNEPYLLCTPSRCVDAQNDPFNCGGCNNVCESGLCEDGLCLDATAGHVIVVGHDLSSPANTQALRRIAGNAIFLPPRPMLRAVLYQEHAAAGATNGVVTAINEATANTGRVLLSVPTPGNPPAADVPALLARADVLVVVSQAEASDAQLMEIGTAWSRALREFVRRGGVVVLFDGGGANAGTQQILQAAGLFAASSREALLPRTLNIESPGDAVASAVPSRYQSQEHTVGYEVSDGTVVVSDRATGRAVVVHIAR